MKWIADFRNLCLVALTGLLVSTQAVQAADTPASLSGGKVVSAVEAQKLQAAGAVVIDTRVAAEFGEEHIKGAISVPYREKSAKAANYNPAEDEFNLSKLPSGKSTAIVTYCNGPACWKSYKAADAAIKAGYTNVNWLRDGIPDWKAKGLPLE
jgi:rhodanese-related sulfurtransferase